MNTDELAEEYEELYWEKATRKGKLLTKMKDDWTPNRQETQRRAEDVRNRWRKQASL
jgi:hypothetical protein